jgi:ketosteroid isomerase-like protein
MSSEDNVKTVQSVYEAFGRGDIPAIVDVLTDDVDWASDADSTDVPWWGVRHGKDGVADFFTKLGTDMEVEEFTPITIVGDGDVVLAVAQFAMKSLANGRSASMLLHHYWKFRDGKIEYYRGAEDTLQTLRTYQG